MARRLVAALILGCLLLVGGSGALAVGDARAAEGSVTIVPALDEGARYDAYRVFSAEVTAEGSATHVRWASAGMRDATLPFLDANGYPVWLGKERPEAGQHDSAQSAADYLALMIGAPSLPEGGPSSPPLPQGDSFASAFARALVASELVEPRGAIGGEPFAAEQGLWLFVTADGSADGPGEAGTAPLWVPLGRDAGSVQEKGGAPRIAKEVREDSTGAWGRVADANRGQGLDFRMTGSLPSNLDAYDSYHYRFVDELSEGLSLCGAEDGELADAVSVTIDGTAVPLDGTNARVSYEGSRLEVDFADLRDECWSAFGITPESELRVEYQARLNGHAVIGEAGNPNVAQLVYTNDHVSRQDGHSEKTDVKVFTYALVLHKVDGDTGSPLAGAAFHIQAADGQDEATGRYIQGDGTLGVEPYVHRSDEDGTIAVEGIDEGEYLIHEVTPPQGHRLPEADLRLSIASELAELELSLERLTATRIAGDAGTPEVDAHAAAVTLVVENRAAPEGAGRLAQTGVGPVAATLVTAGATVLGIAAMRPRRRGYPRHRHGWHA